MSGVHKELTGKEEFEAALATKDRYVFIYAYEGEISPKAAENAKKYAATTDAYSVDVSKYPKAKASFKVEVTPTAIVFKNGEELKRVEGTKENPEKMKEIDDLLSS
ncbi:hypothetical protein EJ04DRAFT_513649 [Polyplosphaeria fusca]|uniref:Thioredoxin domain-containing protein n=1 Tax=Polyplosphaeria fusca TaxID=682080 RepID=A0A9P4QUN8_9PLEO|nr:hypothetical protein EJ04DRAFT_513649 [Polyplosphaeria fusca]